MLICLVGGQLAKVLKGPINVIIWVNRGRRESSFFSPFIYEPPSTHANDFFHLPMEIL